MSKYRLGSSVLVIMLFTSFLASSALAADSYNSANRSCRVAIAEKFGSDESVRVKRKSMRSRARGYRIFYVVKQRQNSDGIEQSYLVKCETNKQGALVTLDVTP